MIKVKRDPPGQTEVPRVTALTALPSPRRPATARMRPDRLIRLSKVTNEAKSKKIFMDRNSNYLIKLYFMSIIILFKDYILVMVNFD